MLKRLQACGFGGIFRQAATHIEGRLVQDMVMAGLRATVKRRHGGRLCEQSRRSSARPIPGRSYGRHGCG